MTIRKVAGFLMTVVCLSIPGHSIANTLKDDAGFESCIASEDFYDCMDQVKLLEDPEAQLREEMKSLAFIKQIKAGTMLKGRTMPQCRSGAWKD